MKQPTSGNLRPTLWLVLAFFGAQGCKVDERGQFRQGCSAKKEGFTWHVRNAPRLERPDVAPPPASTKAGEALYQILYVDEFGDQARGLGQRARILAWIRTIGLTPEQLKKLKDTAVEVQGSVAESNANLEVLGAVEKELYGPIYEELIRLLVRSNPAPTEQELFDIAMRLESARGVIVKDGDPRAKHFARYQRMLLLVNQWSRSLSFQQQRVVASSRFFLRRKLGPLVNPDDYEDMVAGQWDGGDFDTLRYTSRTGPESGLNIGGLWGSEHLRTQPETYLDGYQLQSILLMTMLEPGLLEAIEVALGERDPLVFGEPPPSDTGVVTD